MDVARPLASSGTLQRDRPAEVVGFLRAFVEERKADGFAAAALAASGRRDARVASPAAA